MTTHPFTRRRALQLGLAAAAGAFVLGRSAGAANATPNRSGLTFRCHTAGEAAAQSNSWLVSGDREAFLFDVVQMRHEAEAVVDMIRSGGKALRFIWISHAHPDHFLGLDVVIEAFPEVPVYSTPEVVAAIAAAGPTLVSILGQRWGADGPRRLVVPQAWQEPSLSLEGERIDVRTFAAAESRHLAGLYCPGTRQMLTADIVYDRTHLFLREKNLEGWLGELERFERFAEQSADVLYPGHGRPGGAELITGTRRYLEAFKAALALGNAGAVRDAMLRRFPGHAMPRLLLDYTLPAFFPDTAPTH